MAEPYIEASYHGGTGNTPPTRLVIHATCPGIGYPAASAAGQATATARYFAGPNPGGSAHHVADVTTIVRCLPDDTIAYHAPPNARSLGYEVCGEASYSREQWLSDAVWPAVQRTAAQVKADAATYGIPLVKLTVADLLAGKQGVCGHVDVSQAWHQSDHTDPGPGFPWDRFMALLTPEEEDVAYLFRRKGENAVFQAVGNGIRVWHSGVSLAEQGLTGAPVHELDPADWHFALPLVGAIPKGVR